MGCDIFDLRNEDLEKFANKVKDQVLGHLVTMDLLDVNDTKSMVGPDGSFKIYVKKDVKKKSFHFDIWTSKETGPVGEAVEVPPDAVLCDWQCKICNFSVQLSPYAYRDNIPVCPDCDSEMEYVATRVRKGLIPLHNN